MSTEAYGTPSLDTYLEVEEEEAGKYESSYLPKLPLDRTLPSYVLSRRRYAISQNGESLGERAIASVVRQAGSLRFHAHVVDAILPLSTHIDDAAEKNRELDSLLPDWPLQECKPTRLYTKNLFTFSKCMRITN